MFPVEVGLSSYVIQGRTVRVPVRIERASGFVAAYLADRGGAAELLRPTGLSPAPVAPGKTVACVGFVRYIEGDLGAYDEVAVSVLVRHPSAPTSTSRVRRVFQPFGLFIHTLPVTQDFTLEAGQRIWGFPKFLADISVSAREQSTSCRLEHAGRHVLSLRVDRGVRVPLFGAHLTAYAHHSGLLIETPCEVSGGRFFVGIGGGAELTLGEHPIADDLRRLRLAARPLLSGSLLDMRSAFHVARASPVLASDAR